MTNRKRTRSWHCAQCGEARPVEIEYAEKQRSDGAMEAFVLGAHCPDGHAVEDARI